MRGSSPASTARAFAGGKADTWHLRQCDKVLNLPFLPQLGRAERDNVIDGYINKNEEDVCAEGIWQKYFQTRPEPLTAEEAAAYLAGIDGVALGSDAFFPSATTSSARTAAACATSPSPVAPSATTR